ncbi:hypothetical protein DL546_001840 [Coniochaeta pulveracea]|uniref:Uncharacterized protein n=1 Tax=Coniochaeta pulveracea TaxID=177199 RepID=A0A420YFM4_9PEZI|nr:hypothetical protein DL546_001840 [Coniochaeta pulveracea]
MSSREKSNLPLPSGPKSSGLFVRLLQRTRSKKEKKPTEQNTFPAHLQSVPSDPATRKGDQALELLPLQLQDPQLPAPTLPANKDTMAAPSVLPPTQQPSGTGLKRKVSVRDRLKRIGKDAPNPIPEPEQKKQPRVAYVPKHAASDFSRLQVAVHPRPISPRPPSRQQQRYSLDEPRNFQSLDTTTAVGPYSPGGLHTLAEDVAVHAVPRQAQICHYDQQAWRQQRDHCYTLEPQSGAAFLDQPPPSTNEEVGDTSPLVEVGLDEETSQPSDYERFLARAEERDRAYREQLIRSLSQRQHPRAAEPARSYQTMDSACVTDQMMVSRRGTGRVSGLDSGIGSKGSSNKDQSGGAWERGHRKGSSWTPSFNQDGSDTLEVSKESGYRPAQQPETLKRQASIKKTLGQYFRPARPSTRRYQES